MAHVLHRLLAIVILVPLLAACSLPGRGGQDGEIYGADADGSGLTRLRRDPGLDLLPVWSPDGSRIAVVGGGGEDVYAMNADGSGQERLPSTGLSELRPAWSPDGTKVAFETQSGSGSSGA